MRASDDQSPRELPFSPSNDPPARPHGPHLLTATELRIANFLPDGTGNKAIALALGVAENTVKVHLRSIQKKLGTKNRTQVAILMDRMRRAVWLA